jgi:galactokinase
MLASGEVDQRYSQDKFFRQIFGNNKKIISQKKVMFAQAWRVYKERFGFSSSRKLALWSVPNRVEVLGKHTDYAGGESLVFPSQKNFFVISSRSSKKTLHLVNGDSRYGEVEVDLETAQVITRGEGYKYFQTVVERVSKNLHQAGFPKPGGICGVFLSDIPLGSGMSGSASLLISIFLALMTPYHFLENKRYQELIITNGARSGMKLNQKGIDNFKLAFSMYLAHIENGLDFGTLKGTRGAGMLGGAEDQTAIILGRKGKVLYAQFCPTQILDFITWPKGYEIVVAFSGVKAEKTKDAQPKYNRASLRARKALERINKVRNTTYSFLRDAYGKKPFLRKAQLAKHDLTNYLPEWKLAKRAEQFFKERAIIEKAVECLRRSDMVNFGKLVNRSHYLSKVGLENIVPEIDTLQKLALKLGALGASGFGGGFGGSAYAIVRKEDVAEFLPRWQEEYLKKYPQYQNTAEFSLFNLTDGVRELFTQEETWGK